MIADMFNRIAPTYDFLNRLLSFRQDMKWRARAASWLPKSPKIRVLDLATGTGDLALTILKKRDNVSEIIGLDVAQKMLNIAANKKRDARLHLGLGDACAIPYADAYFDVVTIAFGIRNVSNHLLALREMYRVLKPGGRLIVLEFSMPQPFFKPLYLCYFRYVLPFIGGILSGDHEAYRYLNRSAEVFVSGTAFLKLMNRVGFQKTTTESLTFGVATIYIADKESAL